MTAGNKMHSSCLPAACKLDYILYYLVDESASQAD